MIGLTLLAIALVYFIVLLGVATSSSIKSKALRFTLLAILLSPVGYKIFDMYYGKYRFDVMCKKNAGLNIYVQNLPPAKSIRLGKGYGADSATWVLEKYPKLTMVEAPDKEYSIYGAFSVFKRELNGKFSAILLGEVDKKNKSKPFRSTPSLSDYQITYYSQYLPERRITEWRTDLLSIDGKLVANVVGFRYDWTGWFMSFLSECGELPSEKVDIQLINLVVDK